MSRPLSSVTNSIPIHVYLSFMKSIGVESELENRHQLQLHSRLIKLHCKFTPILKIPLQLHLGTVFTPHGPHLYFENPTPQSELPISRAYSHPRSSAIVQQISCGYVFLFTDAHFHAPHSHPVSKDSSRRIL